MIDLSTKLCYHVSSVTTAISTAPTINMAATGANIKALLKARGLKVADVQATCGFNTPQAIFKWMRGDAMPSIDNLVILSHLLGVTIDQIIIIN